MSQALGVPLGTYHDWEAGRHQPSGNLLDMAVAHIGCGFALTSGQFERIKNRKRIRPESDRTAMEGVTDATNSNRNGTAKGHAELGRNRRPTR
jgi:hypothetical protein